jgi:ribosomal protein S12 methylthiotransferase
VREAQIDRAGCFAYSPVDGAVANELPGMLATELREERRARFMAVAEAVSGPQAAEPRRRAMQVLVDFRVSARPQGRLRRLRRRPGIDGRVRQLAPEKALEELQGRRLHAAQIVAADGHDLVGVPNLRAPSAMKKPFAQHPR